MRIRRVISGILPCVKITSLNRDANVATYVRLDTLRLVGAAQQKVEEKWWKGSVALLKGSVYTIGLCVPRLPSEKVSSVGSWKIGIKSHHQILQGHMAPRKKIGKEKGPSQGIMQKVPVSRAQSVCAKMWRKNTGRTFATRKRRRQRSMGLGEKCPQAQK